MVQHYDAPCTAPLKVIEIFDRNIGVHPEAVRAFRRLDRVFKRNARKYWKHLKHQADTGAYNCRKIGGTNTWSNHAFATAIDIDWNENGYGKDPFDCPIWKRGRRAVRKLEKEGVFRWGGRYRTPDAMHFEVMLTPAELKKKYKKDGRRKWVKRDD